MAGEKPTFSMGIEEEYLLVNRQTRDLERDPPKALLKECQQRTKGRVSPEFLQCQIEIGTKPCADISEARDDLRRLRATVAKHAAGFGLAPIAASCHPLAEWKRQHHTDKQRQQHPV